MSQEVSQEVNQAGRARPFLRPSARFPVQKGEYSRAGGIPQRICGARGFPHIAKPERGAKSTPQPHSEKIRSAPAAFNLDRQAVAATL
ncbi:MAG: hypothetical protein HYS63_09120 [Methylocystis sp.]|nr:hypothetical protein [Methylocystis sp.]